MRNAFIKGEFRSHLLARELKVSSITVWRYFKEFERIKEDYPDRLTDLDFYIPEDGASDKIPTSIYRGDFF
jgi:hypothetical protein